MPVLSTLGSASVRNFGLMSAVDKGYPYYHISAEGVIYGSKPNVLSNSVTVKVDYDNIPRIPAFIFAKNKLIVGGRYSSIDSGTTWVNTGPSYVYGDTPPVAGLNGVGAHRPTNDAVVIGFYEWLGDNQARIGFSGVESNGNAIYSSVIISTGSSTGFKGIIYSPALDAFFWMGLGGAIRVYSGSSPSTLLSSGTIGNNGPYKLSVDSQGYPILPCLVSGSTYQLRRITNTNLNFVGMGDMVNIGYGAPQSTSQFFYNSSTNLYYRTDVSAGTLYFGYSSDAIAWTNTAIQYNIISSGWAVNSHIYKVDNTLRANCLLYDSSNGYYVTRGYVSADSGSSWAFDNAYVASTKRIIG